MRRTFGWIAAALLVVLAAWKLYESISPRAEQQKPLLFVPKTVDGRSDFWRVLGMGVQTAAKEFGVQVQTVGTVAETDVDGQIALLERAIEERPRAIVLAASDYNRVVPVAKRIQAAGIPLITVDAGLNGGIAASFVATDNYEAGRKAGEAALRLLPQDATIAVVSFVKGTATSMERERGVRERLAEAPGVNVLEETYFSDGSIDKAYRIVSRLLRERPDIQGFVCLNEPTTTGAAKALQESGRAGEVKLVGFDSSTDEIDYLEADVIQAIVVQNPFNMGYLAVRAAVDAARGKRTEPVIDTGSEVITKQNLYNKENQKLLFPFDDPD
ncbi:substrate-binding domain-containing protein [Cohnella sp. CFH 77786]|uniref:substrate-binding domain-containing protein n=1 Tax=Cohnella sp. CFH 77786 TaxID=2662265 RepID=UPI001C60E61C|nr:substrate-binding domain-containing protein [Cohnella sp. CFH 77786]MBW5447802.1 substrate-binding domain-containing protein [Cohnella sp. CFH 77786]